MTVDGEEGTVLAECERGFLPLGGGIEKQGFDYNKEEIESSHPFIGGTNGATGWVATVVAIDKLPPQLIHFEVWVVCARPSIVFGNPGRAG